MNYRSLFRAGDAADLAYKIDYWLNHPKERKEMERCYAKAASKYSLTHSVHAFMEMCEDMVRMHRNKMNSN